MNNPASSFGLRQFFCGFFFAKSSKSCQEQLLKCFFLDKNKTLTALRKLCCPVHKREHNHHQSTLLQTSGLGGLGPVG